MGSSRGFSCSLGPDSGATCNIVPEKMLVKYGLKSEDQGIKLAVTQAKSMSVLGACSFFVLPKGCHERRMITEIVSRDLEGGPLMGWKMMKAWCLLSKTFPNIVEEVPEVEVEEGHAGDGSVVLADDTVRSVRGAFTSDRQVDKLESQIDKNVSFLDKQMEGQRCFPEFLYLEAKLRNS